MWKTFLRPAMIFIPFCLGILFPQVHVLNDVPWNAVRWALCIMVFLSCLQLNFAQLKVQKEHWRILAANLGMGLLPFLLFRWLLPDQPDLAKAAFFIGITPTATAAPVVVSFLNGRIGFALTGFAITNVFISLSLLGLLPLVTGNLTLDFFGRVAWTLIQVIALPLIAALILRRLIPRARDFPKKCKMFSFSLWSFTLFVLAATARQHFIDHPEEPVGIVLAIGGISLVICAMNFYLGGKLSSHRLCRESSQILGQKNTTFTMYLALHYASPLIAMGPIFYILWHNTWNAWQMYRCDRHRTGKKHSPARCSWR